MIAGSKVAACHISRVLTAVRGMSLQPSVQGWVSAQARAFSAIQRGGEESAFGPENAPARRQRAGENDRRALNKHREEQEGLQGSSVSGPMDRLIFHSPLSFRRRRVALSVVSGGHRDVHPGDGAAGLVRPMLRLPGDAVHRQFVPNALEDGPPDERPARAGRERRAVPRLVTDVDEAVEDRAGSAARPKASRK